jgi:type VI secretion system protein ImpK
LSDNRPFRSWASAKEENKPSFWTRLRSGFSRKPAEYADGVTADSVGTDEPGDSDTALQQRPLEPDSDLKFFEAPTEIVPELALRAKPGFFLRLFRRRRSAPGIAPTAAQTEPLVEEPLIPTNEYPADASSALEPEPFVSVDDALPIAGEQVTDNGGGESGPGVFSRFFGKKKQRPSLEVEIHEDRIAAAADALQEVGEQTFADQLEEPVTPDSFDSVDEALPDLPLIELNDTPLPSPVPTKPAAKDAAAYFGDTLDPNHFPEAELDRDTDEFEVVTDAAFAETQPGIGVDDDTAQVSRKSLIQKLLAWRSQAKEAEVESSTVVEAPPVFLFSKFRMFYNEIIRLKHQKTELSAGFSTAIMTDSTLDFSPEGVADSTSKSLASMLELQAAEAMWMGGEAAERYPEAQYAMAALADDLLLHMDWEGKFAWPKHALEPKLFKTRAAEVELFRRIDKLLKELPDSASARDLARVYLFVIAAGFKGKYRQFGLTRALAEYRQRLYEYIHHGADALMLYGEDRRIFPDTAKSTLVGHAVGRFSAAQRWAAILVFLVASYTLVAHFAWTRVSADLEDVTARIKSTATTP